MSSMNLSIRGMAGFFGILLVAATFGFSALPTATHAFTGWDGILPNGLVPCGNNTRTLPAGAPGNTCEAGELAVVDECGVCHMVQLAQNILTLFVFLGIVLATLLFVNAGILYLTAAGNPGNVAKAHKIFLNTVVGLMLVLAAWLIIDVVMRTIADTDTRFGLPWEQILCENAQAVNCIPPIGQALIPVDGFPGAGPGTTPGTPAGLQTAEQDTLVRTNMQQAGIGVNAGYPQTSLAGLQLETQQGVISLKNACDGLRGTAGGDCDVVITGGTEGGVHEDGEMSHGNGYKLDLRTTDTVNQFIEGGSWTQLPDRGGVHGGEQYTRTFDSTGTKATCVKEGQSAAAQAAGIPPHWDCTFSSA